VKPRVVSLTCSNTEILCALGCAELLVGVDDHSDRPEEVLAGLPRVGPDLQIDIAAVCALEPDLVLASLTVPGHERVVSGLEAAGLAYLAPEPVSLEDVYASIVQIAQALGVPERGERLVREMRAELQPVNVAAPPGILVQWWNRPTIAPGRLSWVHDLLELAGARNPLGGEGVKSRPLADEEVAALDPDAIVVAWCGVDPRKYRPEVVRRNPAWQEVRAVQRGAVFCVPEAYLGRPGPGLVAGYRALREIVEVTRADRQSAT
jgi:iron complex transport system substrate-binding protein